MNVPAEMIQLLKQICKDMYVAVEAQVKSLLTFVNYNEFPTLTYNFYQASQRQWRYEYSELCFGEA